MLVIAHKFLLVWSKERTGEWTVSKVRYSAGGQRFWIADQSERKVERKFPCVKIYQWLVHQGESFEKLGGKWSDCTICYNNDKIVDKVKVTLHSHFSSRELGQTCFVSVYSYLQKYFFFNGWFKYEKNKKKQFNTWKHLPFSTNVLLD